MCTSDRMAKRDFLKYFKVINITPVLIQLISVPSYPQTDSQFTQDTTLLTQIYNTHILNILMYVDVVADRK